MLTRKLQLRGKVGKHTPTQGQKGDLSGWVLGWAIYRQSPPCSQPHHRVLHIMKWDSGDERDWKTVSRYLAHTNRAAWLPLVQTPLKEMCTSAGPHRLTWWEAGRLEQRWQELTRCLCFVDYDRGVLLHTAPPTPTGQKVLVFFQWRSLF